ncbi:MAG: hypothetical protein Faunusvirus67_3 [Faunusvirus sp.]|jgi:ankyrin repeat protein|uniref:Uncharacterized protein n=1 Tax=Faunusvirus sp. TaxID=2487766 RepID=A0A3G4ZY77_9VIRU|nr:MAG: hypothetical protein Faunusvirus67_3 [Faunusvirus sp.]
MYSTDMAHREIIKKNKYQYIIIEVKMHNTKHIANDFIAIFENRFRNEKYLTECIEYIEKYKSTKFFDIIIDGHHGEYTPLTYILTCKYDVHDILDKNIYIYIYLVVKMIECGANINKCDGEGWSPLIYASCHGYNKLVDLLLEIKCDLNLQTDIGDTAAMFALGAHNYDILYKLVQNGADLDITDIDGHSLWAMLSRHEHDNSREDIFINLIKYGAKFEDITDRYIIGKNMKKLEQYIRDVYFVRTIDEMNKYEQTELKYFVKIICEFIV